MYDPEKYGLSIDEIPTWMRPRYRGIDWALLAAVLLSFVMCAPLLTRAGLPPAPDAELQMYRILEVANNLETGVLYPRWAASFNYGYGSPIFNYLAPLPHYLGGFYVTLTQEAPHNALKFVLFVPIFLLGIGTLLFVRRRWGDLAGVLATVIVLFSPYASLLGPYLLADTAGLWALALMVWCLWALDRALSLGQGRDLMLLGLCTAGLLLADAALSPVLFGIVLLWGVVMAGLSRWRVFWRVAAAGLALGFLAAAFYWLPAWGEGDAVRWQAISAYPDALERGELLQATPEFDRNAFNLPATPYLGVATWLLGGLGAVWLGIEVGLKLKGITAQTWQELGAALFFLPLSLGAAGLILFGPEELGAWLVDFEVLKATDFLGLLVLGCAILAGQVVVMLERYLQEVWRRGVGLAILGVIVAVSAARGLYVPEFLPVQLPISSDKYLNLELRGYTLGTLQNGQLLPAEVGNLPTPTRPSGDTVGGDKIDRQSLLPNTPVTIITHNSVQDKFVIDSPGEQVISLFTFYYPGWEARRNGTKVTIFDENRTDGLITIPLRTGRNEVDLRFKNTMIRTLSWLVSAVGMVGLLGAAYGLERRQDEVVGNFVNPLQMRLMQQRHRLLGGLGLVLALFCALIRIEPNWVTSQSSPHAIPKGITAMERIVENSFSFLGYRLDDTNVGTGDNVLLSVYWQANYPNLQNFQIRFSVYDEDGAVVEQAGYRHLANWPTRLWPLQKYIISKYRLRMPDASGMYHLALEVGECERFDLALCEEMRPRNISDFSGNIRTSIVLPQQINVR